MNSNQLKSEALAWLRYVCKKPYVCTECGRWSADVVGLDAKTSLEIEVKVSKADLRAEVSSKARKHAQYKEADNRYKATVPNRFYFLVPANLRDAALSVAAELNPAYGVLVERGFGRLGRRIDIVKRAGWLHRRPPPQSMLKVTVARMSSELATLYAERYNVLARIEAAQDKAIIQACLDTIKAENREFLAGLGEAMDPLAEDVDEIQLTTEPVSG